MEGFSNETNYYGTEAETETQDQAASTDDEQIEGEKPKANESREDKFIRVAQYRMTKAMDAIGRLDNLSNKTNYAYTQDQVDKMFGTLEQLLAETKAKFTAVSEKSEKKFTF